MQVRNATVADIPELHRLLDQVREVHHQGRPDLFKPQGQKYTDEQLEDLIADPTRPIFVATETTDSPSILGYAFCVHQQHVGDNVLTDIRTLYIDDICVDEAARGKHVGTTLYRHVLAYAREEGFYNVTLNVWSCNPGAQKFYERMGLVPQKVGMEQIL